MALHKKEISFEILKFIAAFGVVFLHFGSGSSYITSLSRLAVPIFMIISFYFLYNNLHEKNLLGKRILRLYIPFVAWAVIYAVFYKFLLARDIAFTDMIWQSTLGHSEVLNPTMWFSNNLIILTLLISILFKFMDNHFIVTVLYGMFLSYVLQYSYFNWMMFGNLRYELKYPLGRLTEMIPFTLTGCIFAKYDLFNRLKNIKYFPIFFGLFIVCQIFLPTQRSYMFDYAGIELLLSSVLFILSYNALNLNKMPPKVQKILFIITGNTMGIYCIHRLVEAFLHPVIKIFSSESYTTTYIVIVFVCSLLLCKLMNLNSYLRKIVK